MWGSTSLLGRGDAFSDWKEQLRSGRTPGCQWCNLAHGTLSSKILELHLFASTVVRFALFPTMSSSNTGERNVAAHTATSQDSCARDHESGILEANSFTVMLFHDD